MTEKQIDSLKGELLATQIAIRALILANPEVLLEAVAEEFERWAAVGLSHAIPDELLAGMERAKTRILPSAADLARSRQR